MTKIRTASQLNDLMDAEFAWRKKELHEVKAIVWRNQGSHLQAVSVRSALAMLYAHWEGFVKQIGSAYLEFVSRQGILHSQLSDCFLALAIRPLLKSAAASNQAEDHIKIVNFFRKEMSSKSQLFHVSAISTQSNLTSTVFRNIIVMLGLDFSPYITKLKLIDEQLVKNRNSIAHGEYLLVDVDEYIAIHDEIVSLMQLFFNQISNASTLNLYRIA